MRPYAHVLEQLRGAGLRPTRQRLALAKLLFDNGSRHVTAEMLHDEAQDASIRVSLATVYNTLHQFTDAGLLREIVVDPARSYFDTTTHQHGHFFHEKNGKLEDMPGGEVRLLDMPAPPEGCRITGVDVVVRLVDE
ncbi:MAG: transcriptional repressor [Alphaproteobacteria bacterium]|nr:transcriptional repressor [Alphaproteobacteria bacterium]MBF0250935.1 transcriptional repressor [Alphaproteobacteria bacterium]